MWSLHSDDAQEHEYDGVGRGLKAFFAQNGGRAAAIIQYYEAEKEHPAVIAASIVMPRAISQETLSLLKLAIGNPDIRYVITLGFIGLSVADAQPSAIPNVAEFVNPDFLRRRAYLSDEVNVSVCASGLVRG